MFFGYLIFSSLARKPIVLVPGTYASQLVFDINNVDLQWYCPKNLKDTTVWVDEKYFIPPRHKCTFQWLRLYWDENEKKPRNLNGVKVSTKDFGGLNGISTVDKTFFNISFIPYYSKFIKFLKEEGYKERVDLFGAPNDWRYGIAGQGEFFPKLKNLIEEIYQSTGQKVVIVGHSFGSFVTHQFVDVYSEQNWLNKYVEQQILVAPSFGGAGSALSIAWHQMIPPGLPVVQEFNETIQTIGAVHTHFPNPTLYGDDTMIEGPNGEKYTAKDIIPLLIKYNKVTGENVKILKWHEPYITSKIESPKVNTNIIYNTRHDTTNGLKIKSWDKKADETKGPGDGTIIARGIEKYCSDNKGSNLKCTDLNDDHSTTRHFSMLLNEDVIKQIYNMISQ